MVGSNQEIVVKSIGPQLQRVTGITGATVLGTGEIVLILNPVLLAMKEVAARPAIVYEAPKPAGAATQPTIMVVDDSLTVRKVTGRLLERHGYLVVTARDGVEAMEKLLEVVPDVMLVDIEMPRMDGFDLTRNVRADKRLARVPIIMNHLAHRRQAPELREGDRCQPLPRQALPGRRSHRENLRLSQGAAGRRLIIPHPARRRRAGKMCATCRGITIRTRLHGPG